MVCIFIQLAKAAIGKSVRVIRFSTCGNLAEILKKLARLLKKNRYICETVKEHLVSRTKFVVRRCLRLSIGRALNGNNVPALKKTARILSAQSFTKLKCMEHF